MAGKPGRSGGARAGAGRKKKPVQPLAASGKEPLAFLLGVMQDTEADPKLRVRAAIAAAQYCHAKKGEGGKKDERGAAAKAASAGKFAPAAPPKLVVNNA